MRKVLFILSIILLTASASQGQSSSRISLSADGTDRIIKMYPNPATSFITFEFQKSIERGATVQIHSLAGRKMYETQNLNGKINIDLAEFNRGVYFYQLVDQGGKLIESGKFQVSK